MTFSYNLWQINSSCKIIVCLGQRATAEKRISSPGKKTALLLRRISHSAWLSKYKLRKRSKICFRPEAKLAAYVRDCEKKEGGKKKLDLMAKNSLLLSRCFFLLGGKNQIPWFHLAWGVAVAWWREEGGKEIRERRWKDPAFLLGRVVPPSRMMETDRMHAPDGQENYGSKKNTVGVCCACFLV